MKAADLTGDLTFEGLLKNWEENGRPPEVLIDLLLDHGLEYQAENVRWCVDIARENSDEDISLGVRPLGYFLNEDYSWYVNNKKCRSSLSYRFRKMPNREADSTARRFSTYREALLALIDCEPS